MNEQVNEIGDRAMPPGNSAVEVAARRGFGPLSTLAAKVWHGESKPCVSCGQLVGRGADACDACGEELSAAMIGKMRAHAGPWYVLEHVRPFPGVTCERLVRQIRRGVLTRTTIVRGPGTDHQWRYAGETTGLCKYLGICWNCQGPAAIDQSVCLKCGAELGELSDTTAHPPAGTAPAAASSAELRGLAAAAKGAPEPERLDTEPATVGAVRVSWIIAAMLVAVIGVLFAVAQMRGASGAPATQSESAQVAP